jgi:hypothetical protein
MAEQELEGLGTAQKEENSIISQSIEQSVRLAMPSASNICISLLYGMWRYIGG